jgi:hypothetical protein
MGYSSFWGGSSTKRVMYWTFAAVAGLVLLGFTMIGLAIYFAVR